MPVEDDELRALWQRRPGEEEEPMSVSVEDLTRRARSLARTIRWRNGREYLAVLLVFALFTARALGGAAVLERLGSALVALGALYIGRHLWKWGAAPSVDSTAETRVALAAHRSALERQRDLLASAWRWYLLPLVPGLLLIILSRPASAPRAALVCGVVFVAIALLNRAAARSLQREIDKL